MADEDPVRDERARQFFERYAEENPYASLLLKQHLMIEELLDEIVLSVCKKPEIARRARLSFTQKYHLARAIDGHETHLWSGVEKLNEARNALAHRSDLAVLEGKIDSFIQTMLANYPRLRGSMNGERITDLSAAGAGLCGGMARVAVEHVGA
ncbi:hypothetical protein [Xanthomonas sp. XNM01]|uniref:hypothetical protein n=1 Tax=Xanthomonas sp. XNM01 TaxID=2769289 RepID=UPI0017828FD3|nr:hypothetical protein [Xanthomonas sp. XNM01]MBD9368363.1 hypothetical protein [Xanthomonas sp. XNM01]